MQTRRVRRRSSWPVELGSDRLHSQGVSCQFFTNALIGDDTGKKYVPIPPCTAQLAKRQLQFAAKIASEQSWSSIVGRLAQLPGRLDSTSRKRGHPPVKWDDKLSNITNQFFPLQPNCFFGKMRDSCSFRSFWIFRHSFSPCPYGIVVVVFHFDSGGRKAKGTASNVQK